MKLVPMTQGYDAMVDDDDYEMVMRFTWCPCIGNKTVYAFRNVSKTPHKTQRLHRLVMNVPDDVELDHKDTNGLNCQKDNLRPCTHSQNQFNRGADRDNTSGYKGVCWSKQKGKWRARIVIDGKEIHLGHYDDPALASQAYQEAAIKYHGEFAYIGDKK